MAWSEEVQDLCTLGTKFHYFVVVHVVFVCTNKHRILFIFTRLYLCVFMCVSVCIFEWLCICAGRNMRALESQAVVLDFHLSYAANQPSFSALFLFLFLALVIKLNRPATNRTTYFMARTCTSKYVIYDSIDAVIIIFTKLTTHNNKITMKQKQQLNADIWVKEQCMKYSMNSFASLYRSLLTALQTSNFSWHLNSLLTFGFGFFFHHFASRCHALVLYRSMWQQIFLVGLMRQKCIRGGGRRWKWKEK